MKKNTQRVCGVLMAASMLTAAVPGAAASGGEEHWAQPAMQALANHGWLIGTGVGNGLNDIMTCGQYAALLDQIAGPADAALENENAALTREQAMVMTAQRLDLTAIDAEVGALSLFGDSAEISGSAKNSVAAMVSAGYVKGTSDGLLAPQAQMTWAEGITILHNALDALTYDPAGHDVIYGTATLTYAEFYSGDVTSTENYQVDGISSATVGMYNSFNGSMYTNFTADKTEGYNIFGVKKVNVAVSAEEYQAYRQLNPTFRYTGVVPEQYKTVTIVDGKAVYSATRFRVEQTVTDAQATLKTGSTWGDYEIDVTETSTANIRNGRSDEGFPVNANIQGIILETEEGLKVGMEYLQSIWVQPWEVSFNVSEDSEMNAHIVKWDNLPELTKLVGQKVTSITFIMPDSTYVYTFDGIYIKPAYAGPETVAASFAGDGSAEVEIAGIPEALENVTVTVTCGSGRGKTTVADAVQVQNGKVVMDSAYDSTQVYTISISSSNYADIIADLPATAGQLEQLEGLAGQARELIENGAAAQDSGLIEHYEEAVEMLAQGSAVSADAAELISELTSHLSVYNDAR